MLLQIFFNDLSAPVDTCTRQVAVDHLRALVAMVRQAKTFCDQVVLNLEQPLADLSFGPGWPLNILRNGPDCRDEGAYLKTIKDRSPLHRTITDLGSPPMEGIDYRMGATGHLPGCRAPALGYAHHFRGIALSLPTHVFWERAFIALDLQDLSPAGDLQTTHADARNASTPGLVESHRAAILQELQPSAVDGAELWTKRAELFPNLRFAPRVEAGIVKLLKGQPKFEAVRGRLDELDRAVGLWRSLGCAQPAYLSDVTGESGTRMHLVWLEDGSGTTRCFSDHARFTPGMGRIHFILETEPHRHALIGHVGDKIE